MISRHGFTRFGSLDYYRKEELLLLFQYSDVDGRIDVLRTAALESDGPDFQLSSIAAKDTSPKVRHWIAKHSPSLSFPDGFSNNPTTLINDGSLFSTLINDPEPAVSAAVFENPGIFKKLRVSFPASGSLELFKAANKLQRLALMRNPEIDNDLAKAVVDPENHSLGLSEEERYSVVMALFSNSKFLSRPRMNPDAFIGGAEGLYYTQEFFRDLFKCAAKWPNSHEIRTWAACCLEIPAKEKLKAYSECTSESHREMIIASCNIRDKILLTEATKDSNEDCRRVARNRLEELSKPYLEAWDRESFNGWIEYGFEKAKLALHPYSALHGEERYPTDEKINQVRQIAFLIFEVLYSNENRLSQERQQKRELYRTCLKYFIFAVLCFGLFKIAAFYFQTP